MIDTSDHVLPEPRCPGCNRVTGLDEHHEPITCPSCERAKYDIEEEPLEMEEDDQW